MASETLLQPFSVDLFDLKGFVKSLANFLLVSEKSKLFFRNDDFLVIKFNVICGNMNPLTLSQSFPVVLSNFKGFSKLLTNFSCYFKVYEVVLSDLWFFKYLIYWNIPKWRLADPFAICSGRSIHSQRLRQVTGVLLTQFQKKQSGFFGLMIHQKINSMKSDTIKFNEARGILAYFLLDFKRIQVVLSDL